MAAFLFFHHDFGDSDSDSDGSVWVAAYVDGDKNKRIGAYVRPDGSVSLDDHIDWQIQSDLRSMGLDPESDAARELVAEWIPVARERGLVLLQT